MGVRELREPRAVLLARKNGQDPSEITTRSQFDLSRDLQYEYKSSSLCCVEDLVNSLDTGDPPRGGRHAAIPRANMELTFAFIESFVRGGMAVSLPLAEHGGYRLAREGLLDPDRRFPKFERTAEELQAIAEAGALDLLPARVLETVAATANL